MEYYFPSKEKGNYNSVLPRGRMEGMTTGLTDNGAGGLYSEDSFNNAAELMNFDTYAGWCNSPTNLADQMFAYSSPLATASTNYSSFDGLNFTHQYNSGMSMVDDDIMGSPFISGDKVMFHPIDSQMISATNCADDGYLLVETNDESSNKRHLVESVVNNAIPRPPMQSLAEKMLKALNLFKEWSGGGILAQLWVPMKNGAMIAYTGLLAYAHGMTTPMEDSTFTQRFRTDEVLAVWRGKEHSAMNIDEIKSF